MDEAIVSSDEKLIIDDWIFEHFVSPILKNKGHLHGVFDSCHSGTVMDLPFTLKNNKWISENKLFKLGYVTGTAILISGCTDSQTSGDTRIGGLFTNAF